MGERGATLSGGQPEVPSHVRFVDHVCLFWMRLQVPSITSPSGQFVKIEENWQEIPSFITHRLATIRSADSIMLMENGLLQEVGTHQQLLSRGSLLRSLPTARCLNQLNLT